MNSAFVSSPTSEDRGMDGKPGRWTHSLPSPEDMAGAGYRFEGNQKVGGDIVVCDFCTMQAWAWERKDDPFAQHMESKSCEYVDSEMFRELHDKFLQKQGKNKKLDDMMLTPPATPTKKSYKPRRKLRFSPIITMYQSMPTEEADPETANSKKPVEIAVSAGQTRVVIQITDGGERGKLSVPTPTLSFLP
ncbi:hypothetical protein CNYM01_00331 [Colletotrichum nymphaeae SA-01]|uniref:Uncharacterized protein n=1 Tax=Colletotrichum nymphaeae SA-01 TaxID=1460502 RepID=A0A135RPC8_9PEZI|nr:hypothetical protein CNYM01_00331 [Colletotrichum nymphaeae SA-01]